MTIDKRLEQLTERHVALTQTVELIAHMQRDNEEAQRKNQVMLAEISEDIHSLARIAQAHEHRISDLEGG